MTRTDAIKLVGLIVTAYPNSDKFSNGKAIDNAVNLWTEFLADDDAANVAIALKKHIATSIFPPSIAEIKKIIFEMCNPNIIAPDEAWEVVAFFIDNSGEFEFLDEPERVFPAAISAAIRAVGYRNLRDLRKRKYDLSGKKSGLDRVTFLQAYTPEYERARENAMLPNSLKFVISHTQSAFAGESRRLIDKTQSILEESRTEKTEMYRRMEFANRGRLVQHVTENTETVRLRGKWGDDES